MTTEKENPAPGAEEGFLGRWSRRKRAAAATASQPDEPASAAPAPAGTPPAGQPAESHRTDKDMPPLESLDEHSDYSPFLSPGVSEELRRLALRKLFASPNFKVLDDLDCECRTDYTRFQPLGNVITADMRYQLERMAEKFGRKLDELIEEVRATGKMPDFPSTRATAAKDGEESPTPAAKDGPRNKT